jgi:hypothetical protein
LYCFQFANVGPQPHHRAKADHLLTFGACPQPRPASHEMIGDVIALVGEDPAEVRRLRRVRCTGGPGTSLDTCHGGNLTVPLGGCHSGHMFLAHGI